MTDPVPTGGPPSRQPGRSRPRRIVILGNAGSGKSTLARRLGAALALPVVHLDRLFWEPGWVEPEPEAFRARVRAALDGDGWISEGNYARRTFDLRLPRADLVLWLATPRLTCLLRVLRRSLRNEARPDRAEGCEERFDRAYLTFLNYVWTFDRATAPRLEHERQALAPDLLLVRLGSGAEIDAFVARLTVAGDQPPTCATQSARL
jgi:adenylate kinase family enzyme